MTNHDLARAAAEKIERSCGTTDDVFDGYVQETTQIIADTYAAPMAKLERLKRQVAFVKRESLVAVAIRAMQALAEISERLYEHELNTASTMPKEHCEAHLEGRMRLRSMFHREVERMIEVRDGGAK